MTILLYYKIMFLRLLSILIFPVLINSCSIEAVNSLRQKISLEGEWSCALDPLQAGVSERWFEKDLDEVIQLPGTLDENGMGTPNNLMKNPTINIQTYEKEREEKKPKR